MLRNLTLIASKSIYNKSVRHCKVLHGNHVKNKTVLQQLANEYQDVSYILPIIDSEEVKNIGIEEWRTRVNLLTKYGFDDADCFRFIKRFPGILQVSETVLKGSLHQWHYCNLPYELIQPLLFKQPVLLTLTVDNIRKRIPYLKATCRNQNVLVDFLINCPNVMFDDWNIILSKFQYLLENKRVPASEIFHSTVITKPLDTIKTRLGVLEKCGVYKVIMSAPHKINKHDRTLHVNPSLHKIFDCSESNFATKIAGITIEEYKAYCEMTENENSDCEIEDSDEEDGYKQQKRK